MKPIYISFFTEAYGAEARELEATCLAFGLDTDIRGLPGTGTWILNCGMKPGYIRERMQENPNRPIVWLDADARVRQYPELFDSLDCDFACHYRHGVELISSTMFWAPTRGALLLVDAWCEAQEMSPLEWDQRTLQSVIEFGAVPGLIIHRLPSTYTRVFDDPKMGEPVVEQMQASRRLAKMV